MNEIGEEFAADGGASPTKPEGALQVGVLHFREVFRCLKRGLSSASVLWKKVLGCEIWRRTCS